MSPLNTLSGGYKGGSPRVRSENSKKPYSGEAPKEIDSKELANQIKSWYVSGKITREGMDYIINELNKL